MDQEPETRLAVADHRIEWVLRHPHFSDWLKEALRSARGRDPIEAQNDVEMLRHLMVPHATAQIELSLSHRKVGSEGEIS